MWAFGYDTISRFDSYRFLQVAHLVLPALAGDETVRLHGLLPGGADLSLGVISPVFGRPLGADDAHRSCGNSKLWVERFFICLPRRAGNSDRKR